MKTTPRVLSLRAGDEVEIRSAQEILSTLDEHGKLDGLPFMPEMLQYCGRRTRVYRRADKTCDTVNKNMSRRMVHTVFLDDLRCDGAQHAGCQAGCLLFWKEAWLRRDFSAAERSGAAGTSADPAALPTAVTRERLLTLTTRTENPAGSERRYVCQATELPSAGTPLAWWNPRQYFRELWSGNVGFALFFRTLAISWFNAIQRRRGGVCYPQIEGKLDRTTSRPLDLQPGERVRIRPVGEIEATLSRWQKTRGLWFDIEMIHYCGGEYRVARRVNRIIEERTGRVMEWPGDAVVLEGVTCKGCLSRDRLFCSRSIQAYWREIWLERVEERV
jgi:hypothetical protein